MAASPSIAAALALFLLVFSSCASVMRSVRGPTRAAATDAIGVTTLNLNLRKGPGMGHRVLTTLPKGTSVEILGAERSWRKVRVERKGKPAVGWVSVKYLEMRSAPIAVAVAKRAPKEPEGQVPVEIARPKEASTEEAMVAALPVVRPTPSLAPPPSVVDSVGYAAATRPLRESLGRAKFSEVESHLTRLEGGGLFPLLERGAIEVDRGRVEQASATFADVEALLAERMAAPTATADRGSGGWFSSKRDEAPPEAASIGEPFERVWALDYHALALLLRGEVETIEIAERAIAAQQREKAALGDSVAAAEREVADARERVGDETANAVRESLDREYARSADRAGQSAGAFANPFAHYVAAVAEELSARRDPRLRERARAHYAEALEMNPESELFREAVADLSTDGEATDDRIVHVLVAEGFAPEKGALRYPLRADGESFEVRLPIYSPVASPFAAAALAVDPSEPPVLLSEIVDVEAASFRYEQDTRPMRELAILRALRAGEEMPEPTTTSWMTLPARFHAARLRLPKGAMKLALATFDAKHERVGGTTVVLDPEADALIFVRSAGPIVSIRATSPEWFRAPTATAAADDWAP